MPTTVLSLPHLGPQARGLLDRIVASSQQGVPRDDVAEWVLVRLLALNYVEPHPLDSAALVHTPAGLHRWQTEMLAEEQRAAERLRKQLIRHRVEARSSCTALVPTGRTVPRIAEPRMRAAPAARQLPAISGPVVQALPAIAGPAAPSTASARVGARRHRAYTLAAALGAATSLAALLLSSLGPSDPFSLFQHPARHTAVAVQPDAATPRQPVQQTAEQAPPAAVLQPVAAVQRVSEPAAPVPAHEVPPPAHAETAADAAQVLKPVDTRAVPAGEAAKPVPATHAAASVAKPPSVQVAQAASTPVLDKAPVAQPTRPTPPPDIAASPVQPPVVQVASAPPPAPAAAAEAAAVPDPKPVGVAKPAATQTASASAAPQTGVVQASDAVPAPTAPSTPPEPAALSTAADTQPAARDSIAERPVAEPAGKPVQQSASLAAIAQPSGTKPLRNADMPAATHPVRHEIAETRAATHRKRVVRPAREAAARRPLSAHEEVERLNEQSLAAARRGREFHPARSVQASAPAHRTEAM